MKKLLRRLRCKHDRQYFVGATNVYSDIWGYDHTRFAFRCLDCGRKKTIKTHSPDTVWDILDDYGMI